MGYDRHEGNEMNGSGRKRGHRHKESNASKWDYAGHVATTTDSRCNSKNYVETLERKKR